jgi:hypothetical protein
MDNFLLVCNGLTLIATIITILQQQNIVATPSAILRFRSRLGSVRIERINNTNDIVLSIILFAISLFVIPPIPLTIDLFKIFNEMWFARASVHNQEVIILGMALHIFRGSLFMIGLIGICKFSYKYLSQENKNLIEKFSKLGVIKFIMSLQKFPPILLTILIIVLVYCIGYAG